MVKDRDVIVKFLENCVKYSDKSIQRKLSRGEVESTIPWEHYKQHTAYALAELREGKLDHWLETSAQISPSRNDPLLSNEAERIELSAQPHPKRAELLTNIISPRPLAIISTKNENGSINLAPISSVMSPSNTPPYILISLSQNRDGRKRDTYNNLTKDGNAFLHFMPPTLDMARFVDQAGKQLPKGESELDDQGIEKSELNDLLLSNAIYAVEAKFVKEYDMPNAVAKLILLQANAIWKDSATDCKPHEILAQHGMDRLVPINGSWSHQATLHYN